MRALYLKNTLNNGGVSGLGTKSLRQWTAELQVQFRDIALLEAAFTHSSFKNEHRQANLTDNERLEFLGDAVLELCVSQYLYRQYPHAVEGDMTRMRAAIVCEPSLAAFAQDLRFPPHLRLGKGEEISGGRGRPSLLADTVEAFLGALFLDQGLPEVDHFLARHFYVRIPRSGFADDSWRKDFKTLLQDLVQKESLGDLAYATVSESGPAHERRFVVQVKVAGKVFGEGVGRSKKEAEQCAAESALATIGTR